MNHAPAQRILFVIGCLRVGGGERDLVEYVRHAATRTRWRPIVACLERTGEFLSQLLELGYDPIEFPLHGDLERPNTAYQALRMARLVQREHVAIVHGYDFWSNVMAVAAARLTGRPVVVNQLDEGNHLTRLQRHGQAVARRLASRVVTNAHAVAQGIVAAGTPTEKVRILPQGVDLERFDRRAAADPGLPPWPGPTVAVVANMNSHAKGHHDLLTAARAVPQARFALCGDGAHRMAFEQRARAEGLQDRTLFLGKRPDVPAILARVDALVHPSHAEGLPNAILEAMAASRPVVATRVGGIPDVVGHGQTGFLVPRQDPPALATALRELLGDRERATAMGRAGRRRIEEGYALEHALERHDALYEELLCAA
jgi:glycosyltransferase involved in cell wall biosynthesis